MKQSTIEISKSLQTVAQALAEGFEEIAGEPVGFALIVFTEGRASYVSNVNDRPAVISEIKKLLAYWEAGMPDIKAHEVKG